MIRKYGTLGLAGLVLSAMLAGFVIRDGKADLILHSIPLSQGATAILLDARTNRGFVITVPSNGSNSMGRVSVLDTSAQRLLRTVGVRWNPIAVAIDQSVGHVFVVNNGDSSVSMLDADTGRDLHTIALGNAPQAVAIDEHYHRAFVSWLDAANNGRVGVIDTRTGRLMRTVGIPYAPGPVAVDTPAHRVIVLGSPSRDTGHISIIDDSTNHLLHILTLNQSLRAVAVSNHTHRALIVGRRHDGLGTLNLVDLRTGRLVRTRIAGRSLASMIIDDMIGRAFIADSSNGHVIIVDVISGRILSSSRTGLGAATVAVEPHHRYAFVTNAGPTNRWGRYTGDGTVSIIDTRDGHVWHTVPINGNPIAIAVDERTGRGFIAIYGGLTPADGWGWMPHLLRRWLRAPRPPMLVAGGVSVIEVVSSPK